MEAMIILLVLIVAVGAAVLVRGATRAGKKSRTSERVNAADTKDGSSMSHDQKEEW